jgi:hypothetical protein
LRALIVINDVWAVENGFLTPTLKIKRAVIEGVYGPRFHEWMEYGTLVHWHDESDKSHTQERSHGDLASNPQS